MSRRIVQDLEAGNLCLASAGTSIRKEGTRAIRGILASVHTVAIVLTFPGTAVRRKSG